MTFLGTYTDLIIFISYLWILVMASLFVIGKYILPFFVAMKLGNFKITLGFYIISYFFLYLLVPFLVTMSDTRTNIYNNTINILIQIVLAVTTFYFTVRNLEKQNTENKS